MQVIYHPEAALELRGAAEYYEEKRRGLGGEFMDAYEAAISQLRANPLRWGLLRRYFRCARLKRFPYGIIYRTDVDGIFVAAVMHLKRRPEYWYDRVGNDP